MYFVSNVERLMKELSKLMMDKFILVVDEEDREYVIDSICKRKLHADDDNNWCYAFKVKSSNSGCIKRGIED